VFTDRIINCLDCGIEFLFTAGEQDFFAQRGFTEAPKRCPSCRAARKAARAQSSYAVAGGEMGSAGVRATTYAADVGGGWNHEYRERPPREMFDAVCADCGRTASVPFRPSGVRPVYCGDCFQSRR
jgi:CxxC-x17-CxxC domain-containing protein